MNYIKRLETQRLDQIEKRMVNDEVIQDLTRYLLSEKFQNGELAGYVNVRDVLNRLASYERVGE